MVVGICNISYKFYKKQKMPKAYYICAGEKPPFITKDCDSHQDQYGIFTLILYILIYFIFSILMLIEKRKIWKSERSGSLESGMNTERILLLIKVTYAAQLILLTGIYEQYDASQIQEYPGVLLVYWYQFFMSPTAVLVGVWISIQRNERLNNYMIRKLPWLFRTPRIEPN